MKLSDWARANGVHPKTAYRWWRTGTLPVPARQINARVILVDDAASTHRAAPELSAVGLYARVSSHDQRSDLDRQVARLSEWAAKAGARVLRIEAEVGSGMNGARAKVRRLLADPAVRTVVVEHRDRLGRMNVELVEAALSAIGRTLVVLDPADVDDGLVRDMTEVLTSFCARLYGRRSARNRAEKALRCQRCWSDGVGAGAVVSRLRPIAKPFVVAAPAGARIRTRLRTSADDDAVLVALGSHLGALAGADLARRCTEGQLDAKATSQSRRERKRQMTAGSSSRWAGAITRCSEDAWQLARRNLGAEAKSLQSRIKAISRRLALPVGSNGKVRGYASQAEHAHRQQRLQALMARLTDVEERLAAGRMSVCRGGRSLARARHNLEAAHLSTEQWQQHWRARRWFICADGEQAKAWGNETIRWHPGEGWLEIKLPAALRRLANRPHDRYRLSGPVAFSHRGDEVAAQATSGAVRYDISFDAAKRRWYLDASWKLPIVTPSSLEDLGAKPVVAVDVNAGWLAAMVVDASGNPVGGPLTIPLEVTHLPASTRDGHLRQAISQLLSIAKKSECGGCDREP